MVFGEGHIHQCYLYFIWDKIGLAIVTGITAPLFFKYLTTLLASCCSRTSWQAHTHALAVLLHCSPVFFLLSFAQRDAKVIWSYLNSLACFVKILSRACISQWSTSRFISPLPRPLTCIPWLPTTIPARSCQVFAIVKRHRTLLCHTTMIFWEVLYCSIVHLDRKAGVNEENVAC